MDRMYILAVIDRIEHERSIHDQKFADNALHKECLPRFDKTIAMLREELKKLGNVDLLREGAVEL